MQRRLEKLLGEKRDNPTRTFQARSRHHRMDHITITGDVRAALRFMICERLFVARIKYDLNFHAIYTFTDLRAVLFYSRPPLKMCQSQKPRSKLAMRSMPAQNLPTTSAKRARDPRSHRTRSCAREQFPGYKTTAKNLQLKQCTRFQNHQHQSATKRSGHRLLSHRSG